MTETINTSPVDQKAIFDKYGMIGEMGKKLDALADARGAFRCGLIWDLSCMLKALKTGLQGEENTPRTGQ